MSRHLGLVLGAIGGGLLTWLLLHQEWSTFGPALLGPGWGMLGLALVHLVPLLLDTLAWRVLLAGPGPALTALLRMRWYGESINALLPVAQIGGDLARAWMLAGAGVPGSRATASVVADLTLSVLTLVPFAALGLALLSVTASGTARVTVAAFLVLGLLAGVGFLTLQRSRLLPRLLRSLAPERWQPIASSAEDFSLAVDRLYRAPRLLWRSGSLQFAAWCTGALEVWLGLSLLGHPVGLTDALFVEAALQGIRNAAFAVPGALGVLDAGLMLVGPLVGVPAETGLALSLLRRGRELLLGLPGLALWYVSAMRRGRC